MTAARLLTALVLCLGACAAHAQLRSIPADAKRARMTHAQERIELNGKRERLAPGVQIRDLSNRIIPPDALPADSLVKYRRDASGAVRELWILTPQEAAQR
jgi:hypothetical protein